MSEEKEIKIRILDKISMAEVKTALEKTFKVKFQTPTQDTDEYYDLENNYYFKLNQGLRIRNDSELAFKALFNIPEKTQNPWFVFEKEFNIPISKQAIMEIFNFANIVCDFPLPGELNIVKLKQILNKINFVKQMKISKTRQSAKNENGLICIDSVNELGLFIELEAKEDSYLDIFRTQLPFKFEEIRHGYTYLYAKEIMNIEVPTFKENFLNDPDWNFLKNQKEIISKLIQKEK
ncbi:CYTH domain-containing protein [Candidatus Woesearchaeota archaeon]|jgi:adenylate cyclase class IV|nr:CYTH domain-containing protein [Candidatus Woesearchaeota archaeon]